MSIGTSTPSSPESAAPPLRQRLRAALGAAIKERDRVAAGALRSALAAIENAEAVDVAGPTGSGAAGGTSPAIEPTPVGAGAAEAARRELTEDDVERIVRGEVAELDAAALAYERAEQGERARRLREEMRVLAAHLTE
jgi:uncharacterized protein